MSRSHRVAIIGLGIMGRRMLVNMQKHRSFELVALWDPSPEACTQAQQEAPDTPLVSSAEQAMAAADVVYLACPPIPRKAYALAAVQAGKAIFLEKPLGINIAESRDLVARLEQAAVPCAVNFTQAAGLALAEIRRAIEAGETGPLRGIDIVVNYANWPRAWQVSADWLRFRAEGGYTREVISHFMFVTERLLGPVQLIWSKPHYPEDPSLCETQLMAHLQSADGTPVSIFSTVGGAQPDRQEVTVRAEKRSYRILEFYQLWSSEGAEFAEMWERPADPRAETLRRQLDELDQCLRGQPHLLATVQEALSVQEKIEQVLAGKL